MKHELSTHVQEEMTRRGIPWPFWNPFWPRPRKKCLNMVMWYVYQSQVEINQKVYPVRVMVNETATPHKVVTVYRTSKIKKYWKTTA